MSLKVKRCLDRATITLVVSAYRLKGGVGTDPYGIDQAVAVFRSLARQHSELHLAIFLAHPPRGPLARRYLKRLIGALDQSGLNGRYVVSVGEKLSPVFTRDVIYLRPSRTDGDAVSVREALQRGAPVLASDVVKRPLGTRVLPLNDIAVWGAAVEEAMAETPGQEAPAQPRGDLAPLEALLDLYARHIGADDTPTSALLRTSDQAWKNWP